MEKEKVKYLLVAGVILLCGFLWYAGDRMGDKPDNQVTDAFETEATEEPKENVEAQKVYIHIIGAVKKPGVYVFSHRPRVIEVVEQAGGFTRDAVQSGVNQAEIVEDGCQLRIESKKDKKTEFTEKGQDSDESQEKDDGLININTATKEELMTLTGIGESKALSIISYRETEGKFKAIEDIMNITGIKNGVFDKIKNQIKV